MYLQHNKVTNLALAASKMDGLLIRPGETFSFNKVVGNCTRRQGYLEGMRLSNGEAVPGVGGGICQLANLIHWMVLHSSLTVTDRSEHSFDPFPDNGRVLPWGTGCSIVYNYVDLQVRNDTDSTFQLRVGVGERYLEGELRVDRPQAHSYKVYAPERALLPARRRASSGPTRSGASVIDRRTGNRLGRAARPEQLRPGQVRPGGRGDPRAHPSGRRGGRRPAALAQPARRRVRRLESGREPRHLWGRRRRRRIGGGRDRSGIVVPRHSPRNCSAECRCLWGMG